MIIYKDIICNDELLSDVYKMTLVDDVVFECESKMVKVSDDVNIDIGANPSAEEEEEQMDSSVRTVNQVVEAFGLQETSFDKKAYMTYIKGYMKALETKLKETSPDRVEPFKKGAQEYIKKLLPKIKDLQFFTGTNMDPEGMVVLCEWRDDVPVMIYFKDGLIEEKV